MKKLNLYASLLIASIVAPGTLIAISAGESILVDFTKSNELTAGNWNNVTSATGTNGNFGATSGTLVEDLITSSGSVLTDVDLSFSTSGNNAGTIGIGGLTVPENPNNPTFSGLGALPSSAQTSVFYLTAQGGATLTFSGLDDSLSYTLEFQSWVGTEVDRGTFDIDVGDSSLSGIDPNDVDSVYTISGLATDNAGSLVIEISEAGGSDGAAHLNALQLTAIPEPSSVAAGFAVIVLSLTIVARRKRAA